MERGREGKGRERRGKKEGRRKRKESAAEEGEGKGGRNCLQFIGGIIGPEDMTRRPSRHVVY